MIMHMVVMYGEALIHESERDSGDQAEGFSTAMCGTKHVLYLISNT